MISDQLREIPVVGALSDRFGGAITGAGTHVNQVSVDVEPASIVEVCRFLKSDSGYTRLSAVTAVDWFPLEPRFEIVYLLHSMPRRGDRLRLNCKLPGDNPEIDSVTSVWQGANWYEREVFDLFGVHFRNHPSLTRIMMPEHWEGHPLRKDFPVYGYRYTYKDE
jgi:NADH-quinone oxidoreductase subunit C